MKRIIKVAFIICLVYLMSLSSFAFTLPENHYKIENNNFLMGEFDTVNMPVDAKKIMEKWVQSDYKCLIYNTYYKQYDFYVLLNEDGSVATENKDYHYYITQVGSGAEKNEVRVNFDKCSGYSVGIVHFIYSDTEKKFRLGDNAKRPASIIITDVANSGYAIVLNNISDKFDLLKPFPKQCQLECDVDIENVGFYDNGGLFSSPEPPEPSEPEPSEPEPSEPEPKPPVVVPPDLPDIPQGDGNYICYDTGLWTSFLKHVYSDMGVSTNVGLRILSYLLGIWVVIWIVHRFTK